MVLPITALYAVGLALMHQALTYYVIMDRARTHVSILHGDDMQLATRIRRHGNFIESVPLALILMALAEGLGASASWLNVAGAVLVASRLAHVFGLRHDKPATLGRIAGILGTSLSMVICSVAILRAALAG